MPIMHHGFIFNGGKLTIHLIDLLMTISHADKILQICIPFPLKKALVLKRTKMIILNRYQRELTLYAGVKFITVYHVSH